MFQLAASDQKQYNKIMLNNQYPIFNTSEKYNDITKIQHKIYTIQSITLCALSDYIYNGDIYFTNILNEIKFNSFS